MIRRPSGGRGAIEIQREVATLEGKRRARAPSDFGETERD